MPSLNIGEHFLQGESVGGFATTILIKNLNLTLDVGTFLHKNLKGDHLFISHAHPDHVGSLISWLGGRALLGMNTANIFVPMGISTAVQNLLTNFEGLSGQALDYRLFGCVPGGELVLGNGLVVDPVPLQHKIETLGYVFSRKVKKLKSEYLSCGSKEIERLKARTADIFYTRKLAVLSYLPDTLPGALDELPKHAWEADIFLVEATFLDGRKDIEKIRAGAHTHLDDLIERAPRFSGKAIVPFHFSRSYNEAEITDIFDRKVPSQLRSIFVPFV